MAAKIAFNKSLNPRRNQVLALYKSFLKVQKKWPVEIQRSHPFKQDLLMKIRKEFHLNKEVNELSNIESLIEYGGSELQSLKRVLNHEAERKLYPFQADSKIKANLPKPEIYSLLQPDTQQAIFKTNPFVFFLHHLKSIFKRNP